MAVVWLFGQIWLWLIVAFALGAVSAWLVLRTGPRPQDPPEPAAEPGYAAEEPPLSAAEQTQFIPYVGPDPDHFVDAPDAPEPVGHREGHLPLPPQRGPQAEVWPAEDEPVWPRADDQPDAAHEWPPAPHQPGRGG
jgi:hypothetical protein